MIQAPSRYAIQYTLGALIAFAGGAVLLKGTAIPLGSPEGTARPGMLSYVVAALLALTGAVLIVMAVAELVRARRAHDGSHDAAKQRGG
jgi:hypothetical protein